MGYARATFRARHGPTSRAPDLRGLEHATNHRSTVVGLRHHHVRPTSRPPRPPGSPSLAECRRKSSLQNGAALLGQIDVARLIRLYGSSRPCLIRVSRDSDRSVVRPFLGRIPARGPTLQIPRPSTVAIWQARRTPSEMMFGPRRPSALSPETAWRRFPPSVWPRLRTPFHPVPLQSSDAQHAADALHDRPRFLDRRPDQRDAHGSAQRQTMNPFRAGLIFPARAPPSSATRANHPNGGS